MDKRDIQIMEIMAQNCRISYTNMGQALHLSKDAVAYRIKQLEKQSLLKQYVLFVDARRMSFTRSHILVQFTEGIENKEEMYEKLSKHPFVMWINTFIGRFDMQVIVDATDSFHLQKIKDELFALCEHKIKNYIILTHLSDFEFTQLNPVLDIKTKFSKKSDYSFSNHLTTRHFPVEASFEKYNPNNIEIEILKQLADNPRASLVDIARKIGLDRLTVKRRISNLIEKKIILNFGGIPNLSKLGFITYYLLVRLAQDTPLELRRKPFLKLSNIFYAGNMLGDYDMILYLNARTPEELNTSIGLFRSEIEQYMVNYELLVQDKVHHWRQFSKGIYENLRNRT